MIQVGILFTPPSDVETSSAFLLVQLLLMDSADVVSLFSDAYTSALNGVNSTGWSDGPSTEMDVNGNTIKKFEGVVYTGFDVPGDVSTGSAETLSITLFRTMSSDFEIKLVDLTNGGGTGFYYIPAAQMPVNQWVTVDIPMSSFRGNDSMTGGPIAADHNIDQLVVKPMNNFDPNVNGPRETFYMDDMYFSNKVVEVDTGGDNSIGDYVSVTGITDYDSVPVRHMDNGTEVGSEINLTIEKTSANTLTISASSTDANDPIDLLLLGAQDVVGQVNPMSLVDGVASLSLYWPGGAPETTSFEVLWSKASTDTNWMITRELLGQVDTSFTTDGSSTDGDAGVGDGDDR